jgi:phosphoserine phosphatase
MPAVLCLIADPAVQPLRSALVREVAAAIRGEARWLAPETAAEVLAPGLDPAAAVGAVAGLLAGEPVDHAALPVEQRRKRLLVSDMDSTVITIECVDELADFAGRKLEIAAVTRRAMNGEIAFAEALESRVALLAGLRESAVAEVIRERLRLMPGAVTLVQTMRAHGALTVLVSGGFAAFTRHVREAVGFDLDEANELEIRDGRLTGRLSPPLRDATAKLATLKRLTAERGIERAETLAVGDGANDLPMLRAAGLGVAFRAHPRVRAEAPVRVERGDLTALLYLQGYSCEEFVTG